MKLIIEDGKDLFELYGEYVLCHCISGDCKMGMGIAVQFDDRYGLKRYLLSLPILQRIYPTVILYNNVFNLITKPLYNDKPTYDSMYSCLLLMRNMCISSNITKLGMYKLGCHLDGLNWDVVKGMIQEIFGNINITIVVRDKA